MLSASQPTPSTGSRVLVANRGEIAVRIIRAVQEAGREAVAVVATDEGDALHARLADHTVQLDAVGPAAYLDAARIVAAATATGCNALHPGYGFLSENPDLARRCAAAGIRFVGPRPEILDLFGDKATGRATAERAGVAVLRGSEGAIDVQAAIAFFDHLGPQSAMMIKAVAGGGGRGMQIIRSADEIRAAWERCRGEAEAAFGNGELFVEEFAGGARHVEVQIIGDGTGAVSHLGERECSLQRRNQKLIEIAPAIGLPQPVRDGLHAAAVRLAASVNYDGVGTFEFLVRGDDYWFIEANPRLQVEHTITEEITGLDLVQIGLLLADGARLGELGLTQNLIPAPRGTAIQARVNMEIIGADGSVRPTGGVLTTVEVPSGPGLRVDTFATTGYTTNPRYDSLLAKVIARASTPDAAIVRLRRALEELRLDGVDTNRAFLCAVLDHPEVRAGTATTRFIEDHLPEFVQASIGDPVEPGPVDATVISVPLQGLVVELLVEVGDSVMAGATVAIIESMKMQHPVVATQAGTVTEVNASLGDTVTAGATLIRIEPGEVTTASDVTDHALDIDSIPADLAALLQTKALGRDENRPAALDRRHRAGGRTAHENVAQLCDPGSFVEYGGLVVAAQKAIRSEEELRTKTPHDGIVTGIGNVHGERCVVMAYDYTVLAGTQGYWGHKKKDRMLMIAERSRLPVILLAEGGGGRAGDTDHLAVSELDTPTFRLLGRLSGLVPLVGITNGFCFAGNAVMLGSCDVIIATTSSSIGIGGPAMVEAAGLGSWEPADLGPHDVQVANGVIDISATDEAEAIELARTYLSYFQAKVVDQWEAADQRALRHVLPTNRRRVYEIREVISLVADVDSVLELRASFGGTIVTVLARIGGRAVGIIANDPKHLGGAIDSDGSDKVSRFLQLCEAFGLPVVSLCDTPGIMVGPEAEKTALVRHASRAIVAGANLTVPFLAIVLRRGYGIGAQVMTGGDFRAPLFTVSWPSGEFGAMGHEGTITLSHRAELEAIADEEERRRRYKELVAELYAESGAIGVATAWEIDDVIDPADTRTWIIAGLEVGARGRPAKTRPFIDTW